MINLRHVKIVTQILIELLYNEHMYDERTEWAKKRTIQYNFARFLFSVDTFVEYFDKTCLGSKEHLVLVLSSIS